MHPSHAFHQPFPVRSVSRLAPLSGACSSRCGNVASGAGGCLVLARQGHRMRDQNGRRHDADCHRRRGLHDRVDERTRAVPAAEDRPRGQPACNCVDRPAARSLPAFDVIAYRCESLAQAAPNAADRDPEPRGDLLVGQAAEVGELDHLLLLVRQRVDRVVDRLPDHRAREVLPWVLALAAAVHTFDEHLFEIAMGAAHAAAVCRALARSGHHPGPPRVRHGRRQRTHLVVFATRRRGVRMRPEKPAAGHSGF